MRLDRDAGLAAHRAAAIGEPHDDAAVDRGDDAAADRRNALAGLRVGLVQVDRQGPVGPAGTGGGGDRLAGAEVDRGDRKGPWLGEPVT